MKTVLSKLICALEQLSCYLFETGFEIEKVVISKNAITEIEKVQLKYLAPISKPGFGKAKVCDIPIELDDKQNDDFKFIVSIKTKR